MNVKLWKDGTHRYGRRIVVKNFLGFWTYKANGMMVTY